MRLGYFAMPFHPEDRDWRETLEEDRQAVILADRLGFHDAFIGEHLTDRSESVTNSMLFLATLIHHTERIRLATGTSNLSHSHPALVAANAAMFDHLSGGRLILGVSPGALPSDAELLGILDEDRNAMFADAIDVITGLWREEPPYDLGAPGSRYHVTTRRTLAGVRTRRGAQAVATASSGDRGYGCRAVLEGRRSDGRPRLPPALGELPAFAVGGDPLAELRPGGRVRGPERRPCSPGPRARPRGTAPSTARRSWA